MSVSSSPLAAVAESLPRPGSPAGVETPTTTQEPSPPLASSVPRVSDQFRTAALSFFAGGVSGSLGKTIVAPLDRVKIIFQISRMPYSARAVYVELSRTLRYEGVAALFRGNWAQVVRVYPYSGIQLASFDQFSRLALSLRGRLPMQQEDPGAPPASGPEGRLTAVERLLAGAAAGATSVLCTYPLDVVRARFAVQREVDLSGGSSPSAAAASAAPVGGSSSASAPPPRRKGVFQTLVTDARAGGARSLYRGLSPTLLGILPYAAISFSTFERLKQAVREASGGEDPGMLGRMACGGVAGLAGQAVTYPLDVARRRMQTEGFSPIHAHIPSSSGSSSEALLPHGLWATLSRIVEQEGPRGLFKGFSLNVVKGPVAVGVSFATYDYLKTALGLGRAAGVE